MSGKRLIFVPDTQPRPEDNLGFMSWIGQYCADKRPDYIIRAGDDADMASLSYYDQGKRKAEGRRYVDDIECANHAHSLFTAPIKERIATTRRSRRKVWAPEMIQMLGNHEERIIRAADSDPKLFGTLTLDDLEYDELWRVVPFLEIVKIEGILFSHYFPSPGSGKPIGGNAEYRLAKIGNSYVQGHQQTLLTCRRDFPGGAQRGLVAGACYLHWEDYLGPQGNSHFRGLIVMNEVADGNWDQTEVSLAFLCKKYEGVDLSVYLAKNNMHPLTKAA